MCVFDFQKSLVVPSEAIGFIGAFLTSMTRYFEFPDSTFMTDGKFMEKDNSDYDSVFGYSNNEYCLGTEGYIGSCNGNGAVICEIPLHQDTHVCLNKAFLTTVTLNSTTELQVSQQVRKSHFMNCQEKLSFQYETLIVDDYKSLLISGHFFIPLHSILPGYWRSLQICCG